MHNILHAVFSFGVAQFYSIENKRSALQVKRT